MRKTARLAGMVFILLLALLLTYPAPGEGGELTDKEQLGKLLFFDTNLSSPKGQSCATCHDPNVGFVDPDPGIPVSEGVMPNRVGSRNAPTVTYLATAPGFHFDPTRGAGGGFVGGQFLDGRAANLVEQAKLPFLDTLEMHNPNRKLVVHDVKKAHYASLLRQVYGTNAFDDLEYAYSSIADAIAAFEKSPELNKFNSKFDLYLAGEVELTEQELQGLELFEGRGRCALCHSSSQGQDGSPPVFTNWGYANIGVPRNPDNPFYSLPRSLNPDGEDFVDLGLGNHLRNLGFPEETYGPQMGKFNFPTLRNIELTAPYMHNGVFPDLKTVVHFYNTRDVPEESWPPPEVPQNVAGIVGNLGLSGEEENAIVAFMKTLTDDYQP